MPDIDVSEEIEGIGSRDKMVRFLDGYSAEIMEELDERKTKAPLVKSYMLEHVGDTPKRRAITDIMQPRNLSMMQIDENLYKIREAGNNQEYMGFVEVLDPRYFVFYTLHEAQKSDRWVKNLVLSSPEIDHVWLSGWAFNVLWHRVVQLNRPNRYARIVFLHDSIYEVDTEVYGGTDEGDEERELTEYAEEGDVIQIVERRASKFSLVDRIHVVQDKLSKLQQIYSPLYAISQLRFPSPIGRGGHDFYDNGKVTNRSGNFRDHRGHIIYVQRIYDELMKMTEAKAWYSLEEESVVAPGAFQKLVGAPVSIEFSEPLSKETFDYWIKSTFGRVRNRFRLWGNPIWLGPKKVHVYGIDKHLWQPIFLEITDEHLTAIVPKGTCGNTVHRLVTNIQRYIDPAARVFVGDTKYVDIVEQSSKGVKYEPESK
jgi:hypothetical protein